MSNKTKTVSTRQRLLDVFYRLPSNRSDFFNLKALASLYERSNLVSDEVVSEVETAIAALVSEGVVCVRTPDFSRPSKPDLRYYLNPESEEFKNVRETNKNEAAPANFFTILPPKDYQQLLIEQGWRLLTFTD